MPKEEQGRTVELDYRKEYKSDSGYVIDATRVREQLAKEAYARYEAQEENKNTQKYSEEEYIATIYPEEHDEYLVEGAILTCDRATKDTKIFRGKVYNVISPSKETILSVTENSSASCCGYLYHATVKDVKIGDNIPPFRCNCTREPHNDEEWEKLNADESCLKDGTCKALMNLNEEWDNLPKAENVEYMEFEDDKHGAISGINMSSVLFCRHGGIIRPVTSGQELGENLSGTQEYIKSILESLGWTIGLTELRKIDSILSDFGITDKNSIACFLLVCVSESGSAGLYSNKIDRNGKSYADKYGRGVTEYYPIGYEKKVSYQFEERGVGYCQVTWKDNQMECLKYLEDNGYYIGDIDENALGYVEELREFPWETSAWRWSVYTQTGDNNLNNYVNARACDNGNQLTMGVFLAAESFINGKVYGKTSKLLGQIARGTVSWKYDANNGEIKVGADTFSAPNNWGDFEANYNLLVKAGIL